MKEKKKFPVFWSPKKEEEIFEWWFKNNLKIEYDLDKEYYWSYQFKFIESAHKKNKINK